MEDYEYYYSNSKSRYANACSEINSCKNQLQDLESRKQKTIDLINQLNIQLKQTKEASEQIREIEKRSEDLNDKLSSVTKATEKASDNYKSMIDSSQVKGKNLSDVFSDEVQKTKSIKVLAFEKIHVYWKHLDEDEADLKKRLADAKVRLVDINQAIRINNQTMVDWNQIKRNTSVDIEYYSKKLNSSY